MKELFYIDAELDRDQKLKYWGEGPWIDEPDILEFDIDGYKCVIKRVIKWEGEGEYKIAFGGYLCGYVKIPTSHSLHGKDLEDKNLKVHGGITFSEVIEDEHWIGFDCSHCLDIIPSTEKMNKDSILEKAFPNNNRVYVTWDYAKSQLESLVKQLKEQE